MSLISLFIYIWKNSEGAQSHNDSKKWHPFHLTPRRGETSRIRPSLLCSPATFVRHFLFPSACECVLSARATRSYPALSRTVFASTSSFFVAPSRSNEGWMFESARCMNSGVMFVLSTGSLALCLSGSRSRFRCLLLLVPFFSFHHTFFSRICFDYRDSNGEFRNKLTSRF